jgi:hypothetical protein
MSASFRKIYREGQRNLRLSPIHPGTEPVGEVRHLALTIQKPKIIRIKDSNSPDLNESK